VPRTEGVDVAALLGWLAERTDVRAPLRLHPIEGGRSNLTYEIRDRSGRGWVLRRPPLNSVLPSAHDVGREFRVLRSLAATSLPVPTVTGYSDDLLDAPFYVMDFVPGVVLRSADEVARHLPLPRREPLARALIEILARIHAVDPAEVGLADLGRSQGYGQRQLRRWQEQALQFRAVARPLADEVHAELVRRLPDTGRVALVHGDYRADNAIVDAGTGRVRAIVDWELCTLGDPLIDLAVALSYWTLPDDPVRPLGDAPTLAPGFPDRDRVLALYETASATDLPEFTPYLAFAHWRLAMVLEGVHGRFVRGAYGAGANTAYFGRLPHSIDVLARTAATLLED